MIFLTKNKGNNSAKLKCERHINSNNAKTLSPCQMHVGFFWFEMSTPKHNPLSENRLFFIVFFLFLNDVFIIRYLLIPPNFKTCKAFFPYRNVDRVSICLMIVFRSIDFWHLDLPFCSIASLKLMLCQIRAGELCDRCIKRFFLKELIQVSLIPNSSSINFSCSEHTTTK